MRYKGPALRLWCIGSGRFRTQILFIHSFTSCHHDLFRTADCTSLSLYRLFRSSSSDRSIIKKQCVFSV